MSTTIDRTALTTTTAARTAGLDARPAGLLWGIGAVATRTGIAAATLRNWDRRYGVGPSAHSDGGHRRYDESDVVRLQHMARLIESGAAVQAASEVALATAEAELSAR